MIARACIAAFGAALLAASAAAAAQPATAPGASQATFVLYASPASRKLLDGDALDLKARVNLWRDLLRERGASYTIATHPAQLAQLPRATALIVPSAVVLGDEEQRVIAQRIAAGENLLATSIPASLDAKGAPVATTFVSQVFQVSTRPRPEGDKGFLVTVGDTPLTYAVPAGSRVWVGKEKLPVPLLATTGGGYLSDWSRAPGETGLIAFTTAGKSRRALLGWSETAWDPKSPELRTIAGLALDWIEGKPVAYARTWPWPHRGAVTIGVDALWRFENVPRVAEIVGRRDVHASFHFLPADAGANGAVIRDLVKAGHSVGGFGDAAQPFGGQPEAEQLARVQRMVQGFHSALGANFIVGGLRAPQGATDAATERAAATLDYVVDVGRVDSAVPVLGQGRHVVMLPAAANLDAKSSADEAAAGFAAASTRAELLHGYAFVGVDAAAFVADAPLERALANFVDAAVKPGGPWPASALEVAEWWRARDALKVLGKWEPRDSTMVLEVIAPERLRFPVAIAVVPPPGFATMRLDEAAGAQLQAGADGTQAIVFSALPAGSQRLRLRFLP